MTIKKFTPVTIKLVSNNYNRFLSLEHTIDDTNRPEIKLSRDGKRESSLWLIDDKGNIRPYLNPDQCIQVKGLKYSDWAELELRDCMEGRDFQKWNLLQCGELRSIQNDSFCIHANPQYTNVYIKNCSNISSNYRWEVQSDYFSDHESSAHDIYNASCFTASTSIIILCMIVIVLMK